MAEIDADTEQTRQFLMLRKEEIVVGRHGAKFGKSLLNPEKGTMHVSYRHAKNLFDERHARPSVAHREENAVSTLPRHNEVGFNIADPAPYVDILRSLVNERAVREMLRAGPSAPPTAPFPCAMALDASSIRTFDISVHRVFGNSRKMALMAFDPRSHRFGRLIIEES